MTCPRTGATATSEDGLDLCRACFFPCMKERDKRGSARRVTTSSLLQSKLQEDAKTSKRASKPSITIAMLKN